jgi:hypothetical protein
MMAAELSSILTRVLRSVLLTILVIGKMHTECAMALLQLVSHSVQIIRSDWTVETDSKSGVLEYQETARNLILGLHDVNI